MPNRIVGAGGIFHKTGAVIESIPFIFAIFWVEMKVFALLETFTEGGEASRKWYFWLGLWWKFLFRLSWTLLLHTRGWIYNSCPWKVLLFLCFRCSSGFGVRFQSECILLFYGIKLSKFIEWFLIHTTIQGNFQTLCPTHRLPLTCTFGASVDTQENNQKTPWVFFVNSQWKAAIFQ